MSGANSSSKLQKNLFQADSARILNYFPLSNSNTFLSAGNCQLELFMEVRIEFNVMLTEAITLDCIGEYRK